MIKNFERFEEQKGNFIHQIETLKNDKVLDFSFTYLSKVPDNWRVYNVNDLKEILYNKGENYLLASFHLARDSGYLCSSLYAIIDVVLEKVILTFSANDEG